MRHPPANRTGMPHTDVETGLDGYTEISSKGNALINFTTFGGAAASPPHPNRPRPPRAPEDSVGQRNRNVTFHPVVARECGNRETVIAWRLPPAASTHAYRRLRSHHHDTQVRTHTVFPRWFHNNEPLVLPEISTNGKDNLTRWAAALQYPLAPRIPPPTSSDPLPLLPHSPRKPIPEAPPRLSPSPCKHHAGRWMGSVSWCRHWHLNRSALRRVHASKAGPPENIVLRVKPMLVR